MGGGPSRLHTFPSFQPHPPSDRDLSPFPHPPPRLTSSSWKIAPACLLTFSNFPLRRFRKRSLRSPYGNISFARSLIASIAPLTARMSSQPSLSKSNQAVPNPVYPRLAGPRPEAALKSSNRPDPSLT